MYCVSVEVYKDLSLSLSPKNPIISSGIPSNYEKFVLFVLCNEYGLQTRKKEGRRRKRRGTSIFNDAKSI